YFFFQAEDGIRDRNVTGVQTCALPIYRRRARLGSRPGARGQHRRAPLHRAAPGGMTSQPAAAPDGAISPAGPAPTASPPREHAGVTAWGIVNTPVSRRRTS